MAEEWKPLDRAAEALGLMEELKRGLLAEYDRGVSDGMDICLASMLEGLTAAFDKAKTIPDQDAQELLPGIGMAVLVLETVTNAVAEERSKTNTVTETHDGEKTNG